jgi:hypothetical protein
MLVLCVQSNAAPPTSQRGGSHDFDSLIGDWRAHVRRLPERLVGSTQWVEYDGISRHKKLLDSNANLEEFEVDGRDKGDSRGFSRQQAPIITFHSVTGRIVIRS